jgi:predicted ATPase/class 3 adenylate cyclase
MKFCGGCGSRLSNRCITCGFENPSAFKFCGQCGIALGVAALAPATVMGAQESAVRIGPESTASDAPPDGERKTVTALFADIKGSMDLMEDLDPEEARTIIDPALRLMIDSVHHYDGYIVQSTGDGVFALFGAPIAHEDHPQRGLYAALRMQNEMGKYSARLRRAGNPPIEIRMGLNTGEVVVRSIRTSDQQTEYTPIGHSTSLASRMQTLAPTGSILVTEMTQKLVAGYFQLKPLGATRVKGVSEQIEVFEVLGIGPLRTRLEISASRGLSKFVGRQPEIAQLRRALDLAKQGHGQLVAAVADAGVGKSRLFHEFMQMSKDGCAVMQAYSVSYGKASPYFPVVELLKDYFDIEEDDGDRPRREKITGKLLALDRALEDAIPFLFELLGVGDSDTHGHRRWEQTHAADQDRQRMQSKDALAQMDAQIRRRRTLDAIKRVILRESLNQPILLIFEDLHWIDSETQALLDLLADNIAAVRVLMMVNYRPEYNHHWANKTYYTRLRLDPLGREFAGELLSALVGNEKELDQIKAIIAERTDGNPFFMEEMVRVLFDQGVLERELGRVRVKNPLSSIRIPPTVKGILASRIDRLGRNDKELLETLAVIGRSFPMELIRRVTQRSDDELATQLENLQFGEFIYEIPAFPESEYTFKHALTQEVAYDSMLIERRRQIHERAAVAIEEIYESQPDDHLTDLAHHYLHSGNNGQAVRYLLRAARQARGRSAYGDALGYVNQAIALVGTMPETPERDRQEIELQTLRAPLLSSIQGYAGAEISQSLSRALELCRHVGEGPEMFSVMFSLWSFNLSRNRLRDAMSFAEKILNLSGLANNGLASAGAYSAYGETCLWRGEFKTARDYLDRAIQFYNNDLERYLPLPNAAVVRSRCNQSWVLWITGYPDQAQTLATEALEFAIRLGYPFSMVYSLMYWIALSNFRRDYRGIRDKAETLIEIARENGFPFWSAVASMILSAVLVGEGRQEVGINQMREALSTLMETGGDLIRCFGFSLLIDACLKARQPELGLATVVETLRDIETSGQRLLEPEIWRLRSELLQLQGAADADTERSFRRALEIARAQEARSWELRTANSLAQFLQRRGRGAEAKSVLEPVHASMSEGRETDDYKRALETLNGL